MMTDDKIKNIFDGFAPVLPDDAGFMSRLERSMDPCPRGHGGGIRCGNYRGSAVGDGFPLVARTDFNFGSGLCRGVERQCRMDADCRGHGLVGMAGIRLRRYDGDC